MSSSFDQPDDAASWQWYRGKVRSTHEMLSDVEAALELVEEAIESEVFESELIESEATQCQFSDFPSTLIPSTLIPGTQILSIQILSFREGMVSPPVMPVG